MIETYNVESLKSKCFGRAFNENLQKPQWQLNSGQCPNNMRTIYTLHTKHTMRTLHTMYTMYIVHVRVLLEAAAGAAVLVLVGASRGVD